MKSLLGLFMVLFAGNVMANDCQLEIEADDMMKFNQTSLSVSAASCPKVTVVLKHVGKLPAASMGHNWVLTKTADLQPVATAGMGAGLDKNYLPEGDARVLASTKVIGGGETTETTVDVAALEVGGDYSFFCSFPGHWAIMKGGFSVTE